jgi:hypothetical protein
MLIVSNNHPYSQRNGDTTIPTQSRQLNAPSPVAIAKHKTYEMQFHSYFLLKVASQTLVLVAA